MKRKILIGLILVLFFTNLTQAATLYVPSRQWQTIQSALDDAVNGDVVVVAKGTYSGTGNRDLNFGQKAITLRSTINPANPDPNIVDATIIDCGGTLQSPYRALYFFNVGNNTKVQGFTIINGYQRGPRGADAPPGVDPFLLLTPFVDPNRPRVYGRYAESAPPITGGVGSGGAILCINASPIIEFCVIGNCQVAGALGGNGADGLDGEWECLDEDPVDINDLIAIPNGQWGGRGGNATGTGYGGAIACFNNSKPIIRSCRIENNIARGGCGGRGGQGGRGETANDLAGAGGNGGASIGDGRGGGLYADTTSEPVVVDCQFVNNVATTGIAGQGGAMGTRGDTPSLTINEVLVYFSTGFSGYVDSADHVEGGAAYFDTATVADFNDCQFLSNKAAERYGEFDPYTGDDIAHYTRGGALFFQTNNNAIIRNCTFLGNLGGAIYCDTGNTLNVSDCSFAGNRETLRGGAVFKSSGGIANLTNCSFAANSAYDDGGAIECESNINLTDCSFGGNIAEGLGGEFTGYGGAVDIYNPTALVNVNADNCVFSTNRAVYGGGFWGYAVADFSDCYFVANTAKVGGGIDVEYGSITIEGGTIRENIATETGGGGLSCFNNDVTILDCSIVDNAARGIWGYGGGIDLRGTEGSVHELFNSLLAGNTSDSHGGAVYCQNSAPFIASCTFSGNSAGGWGGGVFSNWESYVSIIDSIFHDCSGHAVHEEDYGGYATVSYSLFYQNPDGDFYDGSTRLVYTGADEINGVPGGKNRFNYDGSGFPPDQPLFVPGPLGAFYLNQSLVPPVDSGSDTAAAVGLDTYTTNPADTNDYGIVDVGYHYLRSFMLPPVELTVAITKGSGTIQPTWPMWLAHDPGTNTYIYGAGTVVTITAVPDPGWIVDSWTGTDNFASTATTNTVFMNTDRDVTVAFKQPKTLIVKVGGGTSGYYEDIQDAVHHAEDGDTVVVYPGVYYGGYMAVILQIDKSVTIRSLNPADPCCVATTIIDGYGDFYDDDDDNFTNTGVQFFPGVNAVLNGFTIRNCGGRFGTHNRPGTRTPINHPNGYNGGSGQGPAIFVWYGATALVKNCIIRDNIGIGGNGGPGAEATAAQNAGRGGWGGWIYGGAIYCGPESTSTFENCQIIGNEARGGNGGVGGEGQSIPQGIGNYGGNWSRAQAWDIDPQSLAMIWSNGDLWQVWTADALAADARWYTGYGGGVFCDQASDVTFVDCTIRGNRAFGGVTGQGGRERGGTSRFMEPLNPYELPSFGGGVYCAADSTVKFEGCTITENTASRPANINNHHRDPYLGHGGGVCAEDTALVEFIDCHVSDNQACVGGGLHWANANPQIFDCNFVSNSAYQGGAIFGEHGPAIIADCNIVANRAVVDEPIEPNDPSIVVAGDGGGLHLWATTAEIYDCNIQANYASYSGGGAYFGGEYEPLLFNCLIADNVADRDGAGVSTNIFAQLRIENCTIVDNLVTSAGFPSGYGGGLSTSYETTTKIINSIIWGNRAANGMQVAVGTGFEHDLAPSAVYVSYSDIGPYYDPENPFDFDTFDVEPLPSGGTGTTAVITDPDNVYGQFSAGQNTVRIIISLFEPEELRQATNWDSPASVNLLRTEIGARQNSVLASFTPGEFTLRHRLENIAVFSGEVTQAGLSKLLANSLVQYIEPVRYVQPALAQGIPLINADVYRSTYAGQGMAIAIVDTGVDCRHPMLGGGVFPNTKVIGGYDFGNYDTIPTPDVGTDPDDAHGTCCAGIAAGNIGAVGDYIGGVAPAARIYALKIFDSSGNMPTDAGQRAWDWCITHRNDSPQNPIKVISNSWVYTWPPFDDAKQADEFSPAATRAVQLAVDLGITVLAASGNEYWNYGICWPAAMSNVISVGAVHDVNDTVMDYSDTADILDILAPSDLAYTTDIIGAAGYDPGDYDPYFNGTSAACPYAAGAVAALQSAAFARAGQYLTPAEVKYLLTETGVPITDTKVLITKPRIDLAAAIRNLPGSPIYVEQSCAFHGWDYDPISFIWDPNFDDYSNISEDPNFIAGYLLEQVAAGQPADSPCVDTGSDPAAVWGLDIFTTRTDSVPDAGIVDMGYHYRQFIVPQYYLTVTAVEKDGHTPIIIKPDPDSGYQDWFRRVALEVADAPPEYEVVWAGTDDDSIVQRYNTVTMNSARNVVVTFERNIADLTIIVIGKGTVEATPAGPTYPRNTVVDLVATPNKGYRLGSWSGTDDDASIALTNTVTMNTDRTVTVRFELPTTLNVPGDYSSIQQAFDVAREGDVIMLGTGVWTTTMGFVIENTPVTITGTAPDDPSVVANTIIEMELVPDAVGWVSSAFTFKNVGPEAVLNGITIRGFHIFGTDGEDAEDERRDGENGNDWAGSGIRCENASPTIMNCRLEDCSAEGGDGGNGANGSATDPDGGHGGWPGRGYGGGLACLGTSNPTVINCTFINCIAIGGNGGDGGNGFAGDATTDPGYGGRGGGWYYGPDSYWYGAPWPFGPYEFYTRYSGHGGAVYVGPDCHPVFKNCTFINNSSYSGNCGICGQDAGDEGRQKPGIHWIIDNFGGAVYCDSESSTTFTDCVFNNNIADITDPADNDDPYVSLGGAVALEDDASVTFNNCSFNGNRATLGGAVYSGNAFADLHACNLADNRAYHGGGLFSTDTDLTVVDSNIAGNYASVAAINAPNDFNNLEVLGQGGGIYCASSDMRIIDSTISSNIAVASGGAVYFNSGQDNTMINCLLTDNQAGRDGGAISADWSCVLNIANCTVVNNSATGSATFESAYGGGLFCCYDSNTSIIDSIFWGNTAQFGQQLGVGTGFEFDPRPSVLNVSYSDIKDARFRVYVGAGCTLNWGSGNFSEDPNFVTGRQGDYYLSQTATGDPCQIIESPCVDAGSDSAYNLVMDRYTTRTDHVFDQNIVDMGYHYAGLEPSVCRYCDLYPDGVIDVCDYDIWARDWANISCNLLNNWCSGADIDRDGTVTFIDHAYIAQCWLERSMPMPNPSEWLQMPYAMTIESPYIITMTAVTAVDTWGFDVQYYFECFEGPGNDSGWQDSTIYRDTVYTSNTEYGYRVKARDEMGNENDWSVVAYAITSGEFIDINSPVPDPMTWEVAPVALSISAVRMLATTAVDNDDPNRYVEYQFECVSGGGHSRNWGPDPNYIDTGLTAGTTYCYRVQARDESANTTAWSQTLCATTVADTAAPIPSPPTWATQPYAVSVTSVRMIVNPVSDPSGVQYYFECTSHPQYSSAWQTSTTYQVTVAGNDMYTFVVRARDMSFNYNTTADSIAVTVDLLAPAPAPTFILYPSAPPVTQDYQIGLDWYHRIVATATATDASGVAYYRAICITNGAFSSGQLQPVAGIIQYDVDVNKYGGQYSPELQWRVVVYDIYGNSASTPVILVGGGGLF